jgi:hypothetical protein
MKFQLFRKHTDSDDLPEPAPQKTWEEEVDGKVQSTCIRRGNYQVADRKSCSARKWCRRVCN